MFLGRLALSVALATSEWLGDQIGCNLLGLAGVTADLRQQKIDTERGVLVLKEALELGDLFPEHVRGVADTTNDTDTTGVGDGGGELGTSRDVHARQHDRVVDLQKIGGGGADALCSGEGGLADIPLVRLMPAWSCLCLAGKRKTAVARGALV